MIKKIFLSLMLMLSTMYSFADGVNDFMRQSNKIYVVVAVLVAIFLGIVYYMIMIDKRVAKLEKQKEDSNS